MLIPTASRKRMFLRSQSTMRLCSKLTICRAKVKRRYTDIKTSEGTVVKKLTQVLNSFDNASNELYPALASVVVEAVKGDDNSALLQAIGCVSGRNLCERGVPVARRE